MRVIGFLASVILSCSCSVFAEYPYDYDLKSITGLKIPDNFKVESVQEPIYRSSLPATFDWRDVGLTPVKNQGVCGSCWAVAATTVFQDVVKIKSGNTVDFSEQELLDCNTEGWNCSGGFIPHDYFYKKGKKGAVSGSSYPYTGSKGTCKRNINVSDKIVGWKFVNQYSDPVTNMKNAIYKHGPLWAGIYADFNLQTFRGGKVFSTCTKATPNHAIAIVGWGIDHWIIKNSWGSGWADSGYARIAFGCNNIGEYANFLEYQGFNPEPEKEVNLCIGEDTATTKTSLPIRITVFNRTQESVDIFWIDYNGNRQYLMTLGTWTWRHINTQRQHSFVAVENKSGNCLQMWKSHGKREWYIK